MSEYHSQAYRDRINSPEWGKLRSELIDRRGARCERCQDRPLHLEVHHVNYDRIGREREDDLMVLCNRCHTLCDRERLPRPLSPTERKPEPGEVPDDPRQQYTAEGAGKDDSIDEGKEISG